MQLSFSFDSTTSISRAVGRFQNLDRLAEISGYSMKQRERGEGGGGEDLKGECDEFDSSIPKCDVFSILNSADVILVLCSRKVLVLFKDHHRKWFSSIESH